MFANDGDRSVEVMEADVETQHEQCRVDALIKGQHHETEGA